MTYRTKRRMAIFKRKARQVRGKVRRFFLDKFKKQFINRSLSRRQGQCKQCGKCCALVVRCPFLKRVGSKQICSIYDHRPAQCRHFPIDHRDLKDLGRSCGFYFITTTGDDR